MSWSTLPPHIRDIAERECTPKELTALKLWHNGAGYRRIGIILGISMSSARGRVHRAIDRIGNTIGEEDNGHNRDPLRQPHRPPAQSPNRTRPQ